MTNLADIDVTPARILMLGWQGGGKTGAAASLANAGFKLRILDFDGKQGQPLEKYVKLARDTGNNLPAMLQQIEVGSMLE